MAAKLTRLTHKVAIQLHLVAESCTQARQVRGWEPDVGHWPTRLGVGRGANNSTP